MCIPRADIAYAGPVIVRLLQLYQSVFKSILHLETHQIFMDPACQYNV